jgi:phosphate:Na+ symporter
LENAIAIIFGSNIGTTATSWIIALMGFKVDVGVLAYSMIAIGGIGAVMAEESSRLKYTFGITIGFGLIFLGLDGMKSDVSVFSNTFDMAKYVDLNPYLFSIIGFLLTAMIQSSSASIAIAQSMLFGHMISFEMAAAFVIGSNVGTTVTVIFGAIGGTPDKKRTAVAHLFFNFFTGIIALLLLFPLVSLVNFISIWDDPVVNIALFHTVFNFLGVLLWYPFIAFLAKGLMFLFKTKKRQVTQYIQDVSVDLSDVAVIALEKEIIYLASKIENFALLSIGVSPAKALNEQIGIDKLLERHKDYFDQGNEKLYIDIRLLAGEIFDFAMMLSANITDKAKLEQIEKMIKAVTYLTTAAKSIKDMLHDLEFFEDTQTSEEQQFYQNLRYQILKSIMLFNAAKKGDILAISEMEIRYNKIKESYKNSAEILSDIIKNKSIAREVNIIAINDMHLSKSFSKSLRNFLYLMQNGNNDVNGDHEQSITKIEKQ